MPTDPTARLNNWNEKYNLERVNAILTEKRPTMLQNMSAVLQLLTAMESQVKQVCDGAGVATIMYPFYLDFGREMWKLSRKEISGESLAKEAAVLITKWKARGLTEAVLQGIRTDVFNVSAPIAP
jgi:hypothetical protein